MISYEIDQERLLLHVRQMLWDFGQTWNRMEAARRLAGASEKSMARTCDEVVFRVTALYHQRLMINDLLKATEATRISLQVLVDNLEKLLNAGKAARLDLMKASVKLSDTDSRLALLKAQVVNAQTTLLAAMGYDGPDIQWVQTSAEPAVAEFDAALLPQDAINSRSDFQALEMGVEARTAAEKSARRSRWPTLSAFGQYGWYGANDPYTALGPAGNQDDGAEDQYVLGLRVSMPIFDSGLRSGRIATTHAQRIKAEARREQLRLQIVQQVKTALAELESAKARVEAFRQSAETAKRALADEQKKYDADKSTINFLLDAEAAKLLAESQYSQAVHEEQVAVVNLGLAAGKPLQNKTRKEQSNEKSQN